MSTTTIYDPVTGEVDYTYTTEEVSGSSYVQHATDYDLRDEHPWQSYTLSYINSTISGTGLLASAETLLDDGRTVLFENVFFGAVGNVLMDNGDRWTEKDAQGRTDFIYEDLGGLSHGMDRASMVDTRGLDYDTGTGKLDYALTTFFDGRVEAVDYSTVTGNPDYAVTTYANGRVVADDYDAILAQIDYRVTTEADGRRIATDYDLANEYAWDRFTITYNAEGGVESTSFL